MTVQCCVCKKVKEDVIWHYEGRIARADVSHTYCPACLKASLAAFDAERRCADRAHPIGA